MKMVNKKPIEGINWWNKWEKWFTGVSIAVVISALSYGLAFFYEYGFCNYFGIPRELIEISLTSVFIAIFKLLIIAFAVLPFYFILMKVARLPREWKTWLSIYLGGLVAFVVLIVLYKGFPLSESWNLTLICWTVGWGLAVAIDRYVLSHPRKKALKRKLNREILLGQQTKPNSDPPRKINPKIAIITGLLLLALTFQAIYKAGSVDAEMKEEFFIIPKSQELSIPESQELAILRIYGDKAICASFDTSTNKIEAIFINKLSDSPESMPQLQHKSRLIPAN